MMRFVVESPALITEHEPQGVNTKCRAKRKVECFQDRRNEAGRPGPTLSLEERVSCDKLRKRQDRVHDQYDEHDEANDPDTQRFATATSTAKGCDSQHTKNDYSNEDHQGQVSNAIRDMDYPEDLIVIGWGV